MCSVEKMSEGTLINISRRKLFELTRQGGEYDLNHPQLNQNLSSYVIKELGYEDCSLDISKEIYKVVSRFSSEISKRWASSYRKIEIFLKNNESWLEKTLTFPQQAKEATRGETEKSVVPPLAIAAGPSRGRPEKDFSESSERTKKRKVKSLLESQSQEEITFAAELSLRKSGRRTAAELLKESTDTTPTRALKIKKAYLSSQKNISPIPYTGEEALSLIIDAHLSKHQYLTIRSQAKDRRANIYPSYHVIRKEKHKCYPSQDSIIITDTSAEINLQSLLDKTVSRLIILQETVLDQASSGNLESLTLISKWGCDGATGQSEYKQRFSEQGGQNKTDKDLFVTSLVPLQLYTINETERIIFWQNPRPSSTRFCRPIRFQFVKETVELARKEAEYIEDQIKQLNPSKSTINEKEVTVNHELVMTMVDGKICNAVTSTSSAQVCYICGASPKDMNNLNKVSEKSSNPSAFRFGLSTLHAWIRFFECLLHISYRLGIKKWQVRGKEDQEILKQQKETVVQSFRTRMGLLVDQPKSGGSGTTNDGNTARRFFQNPELSSEITGIDEELIRRFAVILQTLSSGFEVNTDNFDSYALDTAKRFIELYPWYYMPASVHKVLIHGSQVIKSALLPIGQLSEEAQEARNKDCKMYREFHTRKSSRKNTNEDLLNVLLVSSDPIISSIRPLQPKKSGTFSPEVLHLLAPSKPEDIVHDTSSSDSESSSSSE